MDLVGVYQPKKGVKATEKRGRATRRERQEEGAAISPWSLFQPIPGFPALSPCPSLPFPVEEEEEH